MKVEKYAVSGQCHLVNFKSEQAARTAGPYPGHTDCFSYRWLSDTCLYNSVFQRSEIRTWDFQVVRSFLLAVNRPGI